MPPSRSVACVSISPQIASTQSAIEGTRRARRDHRDLVELPTAQALPDVRVDVELTVVRLDVIARGIRVEVRLQVVHHGRRAILDDVDHALERVLAARGARLLGEHEAHLSLLDLRRQLAEAPVVEQHLLTR